jgi:hypothetical protein
MAIAPRDAWIQMKPLSDVLLLSAQRDLQAGEAMALVRRKQERQEKISFTSKAGP